MKSDEGFSEKLKALSKENHEWTKEFNHLLKLRSTANDFDKIGKNADAIEIYQESVSFGENSKRLNLGNYAHDIERIIVLLGKEKQFEEQKQFLKTMIKRYPKYPGIGKWKVRLAKLKSKEDQIKRPKRFPSDIKIPKPSNPAMDKG